MYGKFILGLSDEQPTKQPSTYFELFGDRDLNSPPVSPLRTDYSDSELIPLDEPLYQNQEGHPDFSTF